MWKLCISLRIKKHLIWSIQTLIINLKFLNVSFERIIVVGNYFDRRFRDRNRLWRYLLGILAMCSKANITDSLKEKPFIIQISNWKIIQNCWDGNRFSIHNPAQFLRKRQPCEKYAFIFENKKHLIWSIQTFHRCNLKSILNLEIAFLKYSFVINI